MNKPNYITFLNQVLEIIPCTWLKQGYRLEIRRSAHTEAAKHFILGGFPGLLTFCMDMYEPSQLSQKEIITRWFKQASENILFSDSSLYGHGQRKSKTRSRA